MLWRRLFNICLGFVSSEPGIYMTKRYLRVQVNGPIMLTSSASFFLVLLIGATCRLWLRGVCPMRSVGLCYNYLKKLYIERTIRSVGLTLHVSSKTFDQFDYCDGLGFVGGRRVISLRETVLDINETASITKGTAPISVVGQLYALGTICLMIEGDDTDRVLRKALVRSGLRELEPVASRGEGLEI
ncbi:hypothetical protein BJ878DRAFT_234701 [Calycina marina]|uniref:Uncharacterized protein n=1 Tax=Calycina marina TaxID=1763456 RepID=A0A9P8CC60_9HELO|nr:hypothetical protein BJ878DRAFT_234701 [Calycina marina]